MLIKMYNSLVLTRFMYCFNVQNDTEYLRTFEKLYKLQKRAAFVVTDKIWKNLWTLGVKEKKGEILTALNEGPEGCSTNKQIQEFELKQNDRHQF